MRHLCVVGHPSAYGGADTELAHQIEAWDALGVIVHLMPTSPPAERHPCCNYVALNDWSAIAGMHVIAFCNAPFLTMLPRLRRHARTVTWVNCMCWAFPQEVRAVREGLIDLHLYQSSHQMRKVTEGLRRPVRGMVFTPYFDAARFPFRERDDTRFVVGRISRADADKFGARTMSIFAGYEAAEKRVRVMGWKQGLERKVGAPPAFVELLPPGTEAAREFYDSLDCVDMHTDTFENLPRVGMEAMASGAVLVADRKGGWELEVEDGVTGHLCADWHAHVEALGALANDPARRRAMARAAREKLERTWGLEAACESWNRVFAAMDAIR